MKLLCLEDPGGASREDDLIDETFLYLGIPHGHSLLDRLKSSLVQIRVNE